MNDGWIKLHRKTIKNELWRHDKTAWCLFQTLLMIADTRTGIWSGGRYQLCEAYGVISPSTLYGALKRLEKAKMVTLNANTRWTEVYICKFSEYQNSPTLITDNQPTTNRQPTDTLIRSKKKEVRSNTNVLGETPVYGKPEINEMFIEWNKIVGYEISSNKLKNRNACNNLLKKYDKDKLLQLLKGVAMSQSDKFAPRISDFVSLQAKLSELLAWGKRQSSTKVKGVIKI